MKPYKILLFILSVFFCLGILSSFFPKNGIQIKSITLNFPTLNQILTVENEKNIDIETNLNLLKQQTDASNVKSLVDSLVFYRDYVRKNKARIHFPNNDYKYYDNFFSLLEQVSKENQAVHILHYGDSQIEMDRITSYFRHRLQDKFGGNGVGLVPAIQTIPTFTISQSYAGNLNRYVIYGDTSQPRASHRRYGLLANVAQLNGNASISFTAGKGNRTFENTQTFSKVVLLLGNNAANFSATCGGKTQTLSTAQKKVNRLEWKFDKPINRISLSLNGLAEIYGISLESSSGIMVDNVPMRGCSGTIFSRIDSITLSNAYSLMNVKFIILQYGGNMMPQIKNQKAIDTYMQNIAKQIKYLKHCNPEAYILFIGPSDMSKRIDGKMQTYPYLPELNEALKQIVLQNGGTYWDMFNVMGGKNSMISWVNHSPAWAGGDYIHFTEAGAIEIATILSDAFFTHYEFYRLRKRCPQDLIDKFMNIQ